MHNTTTTTLGKHGNKNCLCKQNQLSETDEQRGMHNTTLVTYETKKLAQATSTMRSGKTKWHAYNA
jgi:hypothetical protein